MAALQTSKAAGTYVEPTRLRVGVYLTRWLAGRIGIRENTRRDYRVTIVKHVNPRIGDTPLQALDRLQVKTLYQALTESGLSAKTVHNIHRCLRKALGDALDDGLIRRNPAERALPKPRDRKELAIWSVADLTSFLSATTEDADFPLYRLAAATGMRRGEILGLRWRDVDLEAGRVSVRQQYTRQGSHLGFGPPKSKKSLRTVEIDAGTVEALMSHRVSQAKGAGSTAVSGSVGFDLVFCRPDGSPLDPNVVGRRFGRLVRKVDSLPVIRLHDLRHTHATLLLEDGVDVKTVSERLGHDSVQTTLELYGHVTPRMRANAAARFGTLLERNGGNREHSVSSAAGL
jgi:integrase